MKLIKELTTAEARAALDRIESGDFTQDDVNCLRAFCDRMDGAQSAGTYWRGLCAQLQAEAEMMPRYAARETFYTEGV